MNGGPMHYTEDNLKYRPTSNSYLFHIRFDEGFIRLTCLGVVNNLSCDYTQHPH